MQRQSKNLSSKTGWNVFWIFVCVLPTAMMIGIVFTPSAPGGLRVTAAPIAGAFGYFLLRNLSALSRKSKGRKRRPGVVVRQPRTEPEPLTVRVLTVPNTPQYQSEELELDGVPLSYVSERVAALKRQGDLDGALDLAVRSMEVMENAAIVDPSNVMEYYVIEVAVILHKQKNYLQEIVVIQTWLSNDYPVPREDYHVDLRKRLAKANEMCAKSIGGDPAPHNAEWKRLVEEHKAAKEAYRASGMSVSSSGRSAAGGSHFSGRSGNVQRYLPGISHLGAEEFVAVDFETANRQSGASACQVALVRFRDGEVVDRLVSYLKPPPELARFEFTYLHGISEVETKNAPTWLELSGNVRSFVAGVPVYAHNAAFDEKVWIELDEYYRLDTVPQAFYCTFRMAQQALPSLPDHKLPTVLGAVDTDFVLDHHQANSDAEACGLIVAALQYHSVQEALT